MSFENIKLEDIKILSDEDEVVAEHQEDERLDDEQEEQISEEPGEEEPEASQANEEEEPETQESKSEEEEQEAPKQQDIDSIIGERSEGKYKSWEEINESLAEAEQLRQKLQEYEDLGIDDFAKDMLKYRKETGELTPYLEAKLTDFDKMDGRELYKKHLMNENPEMNEKAINRLLKREYDEVVKENEDLALLDEDEVEALEGERAIIEARVSKLRKAFKESQQKFKAPEKKADSQQPNEEAARQREAELNYMLEHPEVQSLKKDGKITFKVGENEQFHIDVNPKEVEQLIQNPMSLFNSFVVKDEKGNPKVDKNGVVQWNMGEMKKLFALSNRFDELVQKAISHGKSLSKEELERELENPPVPNSQKSQRKPKTLGEAAVAAGFKL